MSQPAHITKLITLLNVAHARPNLKRKERPASHDWHTIAKSAKKAKLASLQAELQQKQVEEVQKVTEEQLAAPEEVQAAQAEEETADAYKAHFGPETNLLSATALASVKEGIWQKQDSSVEGLGKVQDWSVSQEPQDLEAKINPKLLAKLSDYLTKQGEGSVPAALLKEVGSYKDLFHPHVALEEHDKLRAILAMHCMNHVIKTRTRVLKNNEHLAHLAAAEKAKEPLPTLPDTRDQGFTRPKILILLPFRNSAQTWLDHLSNLSLATSIENHARFLSEFQLPEDSVDKLALPDASSKYPADHVATFKGNIDDSFRIGVKMNRKSLKVFTEFYSSDIILASPLGLRKSIESKGKEGEGEADFLSSIECCVVDQADVMSMQNWEHLQFVFDHLNQIPKEAHGCDFARVKPWYLDGKAANLRQTVLLSSYETPEMRSLFRSSFNNVAGKLRTETPAEGVLQHIRRGVNQVFHRFDVEESEEEDDARFQAFITRTLPSLLKSAVASAGHTMIFVPSYFDFLRVKAHLKTIDDLDYECISEYSPNSDIARARNAFLAGKLPFLVMTERFHFFRRYRIRGAHTHVFYALPEHSIFYQEMLTLPFEHVPNSKYEIPDESEISSQVLFSKYDLLKLERVVGHKNAVRMLGADEERFRFS